MSDGIMLEGINNFNMDKFSLRGKVAMVTGANKNLGMAYAVAFARAGADLYIPHHGPDIETVRALIEAEGRTVHFMQGDLTDEAYRKAIIEDCMEKYGRIDILVNNAAANHFEAFLDFPDSAYDHVVELNLKVVYYLSHDVAKIMVKQGGGKIINIGSALSYTGDAKCPAYITAKHGIIGITRSFANELGQYNIQTNAICPGFFKTSVNLDVASDEVFYNHITDRISAGRWGRLDDLMGAAVFLASPASDYINGADLKIDGGFSTRL